MFRAKYVNKRYKYLYRSNIQTVEEVHRVRVKRGKQKRKSGKKGKRWKKTVKGGKYVIQTLRLAQLQQFILTDNAIFVLIRIKYLKNN